MIRLSDYTEEIEKFLHDTVAQFIAEEGQPKLVGVWCCPWAGWVTSNFHINSYSDATQLYCPDFDHVEFGFHDLPGWQNEYEKDVCEFRIHSVSRYSDHSQGDEKLNELFFEFLKPIVSTVKEKYPYDYLLEMLNSEFKEVI